MNSPASKAISLGAVAAVVAVAAVNLIQAARLSPPVTKEGAREFRDPVTAFDIHQAQVHAALEELKIAGPVGYYAGVEPSHLSQRHWGVEGYFRTQFSLLPVVLDTEYTKDEWIVADLSGFSGPPWTVEVAGSSETEKPLPDGWEMVRAFDENQFLLRRRRQ